MRAKRPGRFSRQWQRQRAEQADAEHADRVARLQWVARRFSRFPFSAPPRSPASEHVRPYRGFRNGRARMAPTDTGYEEPVERQPTVPGNEHPWLTGLTDEPTSESVIGAPDHRRDDQVPDGEPTVGPVIGEDDRS